MVRLLAASASLTFAFAARINVDSASNLNLDESAVSSETVVAQILTSTEAGEETTDGPVRRCAQPSRDPSRDGRRRGRRDCGCLPDGSHECFPDDEGQYCDHWVGSYSRSPPCRRRRSAPRPAPAARRPTPAPPAPPEYIPGSGRFWEIGSRRSNGTANSPGTVANGWYDPNSEFMLAQSPPANHSGDPYPLDQMMQASARDPHHCFSGWARCCNTEFNCCANCPYRNPDRPEWGPQGWSQCLQWFPECGTNAPHPNLPAPAPAPDFSEERFSELLSDDSDSPFGDSDWPGRRRQLPSFPSDDSDDSDWPGRRRQLPSFPSDDSDWPGRRRQLPSFPSDDSDWPGRRRQLPPSLR